MLCASQVNKEREVTMSQIEAAAEEMRGAGLCLAWFVEANADEIIKKARLPQHVGVVCGPLCIS